MPRLKMFIFVKYYSLAVYVLPHDYHCMKNTDGRTCINGDVGRAIQTVGEMVKVLVF